MSENSGLFRTRDRALVVAFIAFNHSYVKKEKEDGENPKTVFYFKKTEELTEMVRKWQTGIPIPIDDIRRLFAAELTFNSAVHEDF